MYLTVAVKLLFVKLLKCRSNSHFLPKIQNIQEFLILGLEYVNKWILVKFRKTLKILVLTCGIFSSSSCPSIPPSEWLTTPLSSSPLMFMFLPVTAWKFTKRSCTTCRHLNDPQKRGNQKKMWHGHQFAKTDPLHYNKHAFWNSESDISLIILSTAI